MPTGPRRSSRSLGSRPRHRPRSPSPRGRCASCPRPSRHLMRPMRPGTSSSAPPMPPIFTPTSDPWTSRRSGGRRRTTSSGCRWTSRPTCAVSSSTGSSRSPRSTSSSPTPSTSPSRTSTASSPPTHSTVRSCISSRLRHAHCLEV